VAGSPKISVLLPCHAQAHFVREAVTSVLTQDFADWELVASDDASPDPTFTILQELAQLDPRIRLFRQEKNLGMVENWNFCLQEARGTAIKLMGGDDRLKRPDCLSRQWQSLQNPGVTLVACARNIIDESSRTVSTLAGLPTGIFPSAEVIPRMLEHQDNLIGEPVCCLFRRADATRGFNLTYRQNTDIEMWFHLLDQGSLAFDAEPLVAFRTHRNQASASNWQSGLALEEHRVLMLERALSPILPARVKFQVWQRGKETLHSTDSAKIRQAVNRLAGEMGIPALGWHGLNHYVKRTLARGGRSLRKRLQNCGGYPSR
jgi:hypothetical protein